MRNILMRAALAAAGFAALGITGAAAADYPAPQPQIQQPPPDQWAPPPDNRDYYPPPAVYRFAPPPPPPVAYYEYAEPEPPVAIVPRPYYGRYFGPGYWSRPYWGHGPYWGHRPFVARGYGWGGGHRW